MKHPFKTKAHDLAALFKDVKTLSKFMSRLEAQSKFDPLRYDPSKYLGDGFEFFIELFLLLHPNDNRIGLSRYEPVLSGDNGVDGIAFNILNEKSVVQIKYRSNKQEYLSANKDHLSNLFTDGMLSHGVVSDASKNYRHYVFTTAKGIHFYTDNEMFKNKLKCFGYGDIKSLIDNNIPFWENAKDLIKL